MLLFKTLMTLVLNTHAVEHCSIYFDIDTPMTRERVIQLKKRGYNSVNKRASADYLFSIYGIENTYGTYKNLKKHKYAVNFELYHKDELSSSYQVAQYTDKDPSEVNFHRAISLGIAKLPVCQ